MNDRNRSTTSSPLQTLMEAMYLAAVLFGLAAAVIVH